MYQVASTEVLAGRLQKLLSPLVYNQLGYDQLGLRSPTLGLPLMMAAVLTLHNLAVEIFLQSLMDYAAKPEAYQSSLGELLPTYPEFTGCVFNPHSADVGRIFLSVVKTWKRNAFGLKLCSFSITEACQIFLN
ncbi:hypothetical protein [Microcoleus vaginatus]|uniref:hypothetical protein n=1 Tax=Microcoleus vaginatus TaxID=119532 RepID=UPI0032A61EFF